MVKKNGEALNYGLLSTWLYLVHSINEKVESTLPSSLLIRVLIIITALSFIIQKKPGVFKNFIAIRKVRISRSFLPKLTR
ncbi:hypothetical protein CE184_08860 [Klebsiella pneumoniae]|nr:hypothetical protein CE184_08860 [Klebsiella pneumoniae]QCU38353.1 hypothetical protein FFT49_11420 [Klebsiella pneumoniae]